MLWFWGVGVLGGVGWEKVWVGFGFVVRYVVYLFFSVGRCGDGEGDGVGWGRVVCFVVWEWGLLVLLFLCVLLFIFFEFRFGFSIDVLVWCFWSCRCGVFDFVFF